jgi:hypothetical protein
MGPGTEFFWYAKWVCGTCLVEWWWSVAARESKNSLYLKGRAFGSYDGLWVWLHFDCGIGVGKFLPCIYQRGE